MDYSLDSNSMLSQDEQLSCNDEKIKKHKNFTLKSELFSSFENDKNIQPEKVSPKPSML